MRNQKRVDDRIDYRAAFEFIAESKAQVQYEPEAARFRVTSGIRHSALHAPGDRDTSARIIGNFQTEELGPRRDAVKSGDSEQTVPGRDSRHVRPMPRVVKHEVEQGETVGFFDVCGDRQRSRAQGDRLPGLAIVMDGLFILEGAVQVGVDKRHPPIARLDDDHRKHIGVDTIAVQVRRRKLPQCELAKRAREPRRGPRDTRDAAGAQERPILDPDRAVGTRYHRSQDHRALAREVAQVEDLGDAAAGHA